MPLELPPPTLVNGMIRYAVSQEYRLRVNHMITPFFRLQGVLQPPKCSLVLESVYPPQRWDNEAGILQVPDTRHSLLSCISGVLSFKDKETGLELDVILEEKGVPGKGWASQKYSSRSLGVVLAASIIRQANFF
jgi:hypothetical protein